MYVSCLIFSKNKTGIRFDESNVPQHTFPINIRYVLSRPNYLSFPNLTDDRRNTIVCAHTLLKLPHSDQTEIRYWCQHAHAHFPRKFLPLKVFWKSFSICSVVPKCSTDCKSQQNARLLKLGFYLTNNAAPYFRWGNHLGSKPKTTSQKGNINVSEIPFNHWLFDN